MGIRIEFDTHLITGNEARALSNMLAELAGDSSLSEWSRGVLEDALAAADAVAAAPPPDIDNWRPRKADAGTTDAPPPVTVGFDPSAHQAAISGQFKDLMETSVANVLNYAADAAPPVTIGFGGDTPSGQADAPTRDSKNLPWDERIHSGNRALNADGTWRRRRGVDEGTVERVEAELLGVTVEEPQPAERGWPISPLADMLVAQAAVVPPPPPATVPQPPTITFASLIQRVTAAVSAGTLSMTAVSEICQKLGVEALPLVGGRPDLFPALSAELTTLGV